MLPRFVLGVATGLLAGLLISLSPVLAVVGVVAALILAFVGIARRADPPRSMFVAGLLVGAGGLLLVGAINTIASCSTTDDFCGNANVWPLSLLAIATTGGGAIAAAVARRDRG
jgi:hypothetical protein